MPINIPHNANVLFAGESAPPLTQRAALAALLGVFAAEWSSLESVMAMLFALLLRVDARVSTGILDRILSMQQKMGVLKFTVAHMVSDAALREQA